MRKILLVEDEPVLQETYRMIISTQPYICDYADNGREALERCKGKEYDLVLLDIMMPEMDGIDFLEQLDDPVFTRSKVIVMSNLSAGKEIDKVKDLGVYKTILKSDISPKQLVATIRYHFDK